MASPVSTRLLTRGSAFTVWIGVKVAMGLRDDLPGLSENSIEGRENFPMDRHFNVRSSTILQRR